MRTVKILNSREIKDLLKKIKNQFGIEELELEYIFYVTSKDKVYIMNKSYANFDTSRIKVNLFGLYFCKFHNDGVRLSIEGSQLIGNMATKNVVEIDDKQIKDWFSGYDINLDEEYEHFVLLKHKSDFIGCGIFSKGVLRNYVPKNRRIFEQVVV